MPELEVLCRDKTCRHPNRVSIDPAASPPISRRDCEKCHQSLGIDPATLETLLIMYRPQTTT